MNSHETIIEQERPRIVEIRHRLHENPQPGYAETFAAELIESELGDAGVDCMTGIATTGVVGWVLPDDPEAAKRKAIAFRADMDALPIEEQSDLPYKSKHPGFMHACGHDGHTAGLIGTARVLATMRDRLPRPVKLLFQPAEEGGAGAKAMIEEGVLGADIGGCEVGVAVAFHGFPSVPVGQIALCSGPAMAHVESFRISITGKGAHGARPHDSRDPVLAACQIGSALQGIISRNIDPLHSAVVSLTTIHAGTASNVIPQQAELGGTIRTFREDDIATIRERIEAIATGMGQAMGCTAQTDIQSHYPVTINDPTITDFVRLVGAQALGADHVGQVPPSMGAEDFSYFAQRVPACIARLGTAPAGVENPPGLHHPCYNFHDDALPVAMRMFCDLALASGNLDID